MNIDQQTALTSMIAVVVFLVLHFLIFRLIKQNKVLKWLVYIYITSSIFELILALLILGVNQPEAIIISYLNYTLLIIIYILGVFGMMESSLRVRMLLEIDNKGKEGISADDLLLIYNKKNIIKKRLERLVESRDLIMDGEYYRIGKRYSYFILHQILFKIIHKLYRINN